LGGDGAGGVGHVEYGLDGSASGDPVGVNILDSISEGRGSEVGVGVGDGGALVGEAARGIERGGGEDGTSTLETA